MKVMDRIQRNQKIKEWYNLERRENDDVALFALSEIEDDIETVLATGDIVETMRLLVHAYDMVNLAQHALCALIHIPKNAEEEEEEEDE